MKYFNLKQTGDDEVELRIEGDIIPADYVWLYEWLDEPYAAPNKFREELKKYDGKNITVWINSNGGYMIAGCAIYTALMEFKGKKIVKIDGIAASAASVIAMAGDTILMSPASLIMIHNPWTFAVGDVHEFEKEVRALNACKEMIINAYEKKTKLSREKISDFMDEEKFFSPQEAIENCFSDGMLYQDEEQRDFKNMISGARLIFNSIDRNTVYAALRPTNINIESTPRTVVPTEPVADGYEYLQAKLNLEKSRFI